MSYPTLMIVPNVAEVELDFRNKGFRVFTVENLEEAREALEGLRGVYFEGPIVFTDVAKLIELDVFRRFLEETQLQVILLASRDAFPSTILSRVKRVMKEPRIVPFERDDPTRVLELMESEDFSYESLVKSCPSMAEMHFLSKRTRLMGSRILQALLASSKGSS